MTMTFADVAVTYVFLSALFVAAVIVRALWKVAYRVFSEALDGVARDYR